MTIILQAILIIFVAIVVLLNGMVIVITYWNPVTKFCPFCRVFSLSYLGNIIGALSLFLNDIHNSVNGGEVVIGFDSKLLAMDGYFFLYMGVALNMCGLVTSTYVRYYLLKSINRPKPAKSTREIILRFFIPQIILTALSSGGLLLVQHYTKKNLLTISLLLTFIPLCFVIVWNIQLTRYLQEQQKLGRQVNQSSSVKRLKRAQIFILATTGLYVLYLVIGIISFTISVYLINDDRTNEVIFWILRVLFVLVFTLEAKMFLYKIQEGRKTIKKAFRTMFCLNHARKLSRNNQQSTRLRRTQQIEKCISISSHINISVS